MCFVGIPKTIHSYKTVTPNLTIKYLFLGMFIEGDSLSWIWELEYLWRQGIVTIYKTVESSQRGWNAYKSQKNSMNKIFWVFKFWTKLKIENLNFFVEIVEICQNCGKGRIYWYQLQQAYWIGSNPALIIVDFDIIIFFVS